MSILCVGSLALDTIKTPFGRVKDVLGGSAVYFSISASFFTDVSIVGVVGRDFPDEYIEKMREKKIDLSGLKIKDGKTFRWNGFYDYDLNQAHTIETQLNVFEDFEPVIPDNLREVDTLFLANIAPELQKKVLNSVKKTKFIALDTMNLWISTKKEELLDVMSRVNAIIINENEARMLTDESNLIKASGIIKKMGPQFVIIKRGEYGSLLFNEDNIFFAPAYPLEDVFDPTGEFDIFNIKRAIIYGSVMASYAVEKFTITRLLEISDDDIFERARAFKRMVDFEL